MIARRLLEHIEPATRVWCASCLLDFCLLAWPLSSLTVFSSSSAAEQGILGLSWLALILTCVDIVATTDVRRTQEAD